MKKFAITCLLFIVVLFSFSAVFADQIDNMFDQIRTEVAATVIAEVQQTLEADNIEIIVRNQNTPAPLFNEGFVWGTWKPTPTYYTYLAELVKQDKNYMHYPHGTRFTVTWTIKNIGPKEWDKHFYLRYYKGQGSMDGDQFMLPWVVDRGDTIDFTLTFECADEPGIYNSYWELVDNNATVILDNIWVGWQVDDWRDYE